MKRFLIFLILLSSLAFVPNVCADTYSTFQIKRYYSANRRYFVEVTEKKRAMLYLNGRRLRGVWSQILADLPNELFVVNDGKRIAIVDRYYGNEGISSVPVVAIYDEQGKQLSSYRLGEVSADSSRLIQTISNIQWYQEARLSSEGQFLIIETHITKREWEECHKTVPPEENDKCWETVPYQQLRFAMSSGKLVERVSIASR